MKSTPKILAACLPPVKRLLKEIEQLRHKIEELETSVASHQADLDNLNEYNTVLIQQNDALRKQDAALLEHNTVLEQQNIALRKQDAILNKHNTVLEKQNIALRKQDAILNEHNTMLEQQNVALRQQDTAQTHIISSLQAEVSNLQQITLQDANQIQKLNEYQTVWSRFFFHNLPVDSPCTAGFATGMDLNHDNKLVSRIGKIAKDTTREANEGEYVWDLISKDHKEYIKNLDQDHLSKLASSPLTAGLLQGQAMTSMLQENEQQRSLWCNAALDALLSLCEAMELIDIENIELGIRSHITECTPDDLLDTISRHVGFEVVAPDVLTGLFGLKTKRGVFTFRHFIAFYSAWRLSELYPNKTDIRIGEIGAGAGLVAYYAWQFGFRDYTIFDLPTVNIVQSWFLGQSIPDAKLILSDTKQPFSEKGIRVLPAGLFDHTPESFWDVVVNIDSIPEIEPEIVAEYLKGLKTKTALIYSHNHEARPTLNGRTYLGQVDSLEMNEGKDFPKQETVAWHVSQSGGFKRIARNRAWLRPGYVEEWYTPVKTECPTEPIKR